MIIRFYPEFTEVMNKIFFYIFALVLAFAIIINLSCSEHEICHSECVKREDTCIDSCDESYPEGSDERQYCYDYCGNVYYKCMQKCDSIGE